jgi:hypothetical protein
MTKQPYSSSRGQFANSSAFSEPRVQLIASQDISALHFFVDSYSHSFSKANPVGISTQTSSTQSLQHIKTPKFTDFNAVISTQREY